MWRSGQLAGITGASIPDPGGTYVLLKTQSQSCEAQDPNHPGAWRGFTGNPEEGKILQLAPCLVIYHYGNCALFRCPHCCCWGRIVDATAVQVTVPSSFLLQKCLSNLRGPSTATHT